MSTPNWVDGGRLAPPPISRTPVRNSQNGTQTTIMIEPTPKYQQFYNTTRREMDRQRLEYHVAEENSLELPKAQSMSRSTTSDSLPSPSIVCSHGGDGSTPFSHHATEAVKPKPPRGKRTGPLDMETRTKTAFKRKFKLTCDFHRTKKISCNCHDFSKLEAAYLESLVDEGQRTKASRGRAVRPFGELGTFGAGGAGGSATATIPSYLNFDFDLSDLPAGHEPPPEVHANLRPALDFDIQSKASVTAIVTAPRESPFYLGLPPHVPIPAEFAIGSSMPFRNRWECRYQHTTEDTRSLASMSACAWTGPFEELHNHFATQHHPFRLAEGAHRSICSGCEAASLNWVDERACIEPEKCLPDDWQKWLFGAPVSQSKPLPPPRLAMSEASGSRSSWLNPAWNMTTPGSSNTERSNLPYGSYTNNSGFHKHFTSGYENSEANDGEENNEAYPVCEELQNRCRCRFDATYTTRYCCIRSSLPLWRWKSEYISALYDPRLSLPSRLKPWRHLALSLLTPLVVFHLLGNHSLIYLRGVSPAFSTITCCLEWYIASTILGSLVAGIAMGSLRTMSHRDDGLHVLAPAV
ncbi:hypothetical protein F4801DRAFT_284016 [Xylaria longipes]|nr:hypothetical protein F4801DRAFT_284016 [Xylaria longipes]